MVDLMLRLLFLTVAAVTLLAVLARMRKRPAAPAAADAWRPAALHAATLAYAEMTFRSHRHGLVARLDRAYWRAGELIVVELKTRRIARIYRSDIIEMSVQRIALAESSGKAVSTVGYVVIQHPQTGVRTALRADLLALNDVLELKRRREAILLRWVGIPMPAHGVRLCANCAFLVPCHAKYADRDVAIVHPSTHPVDDT